MRGKYVIVNSLGLEQAIIFPGSVSHDFAVCVEKAKPIAAGFFQVDDHGEVRVEGHSNTLHLHSRHQDPEIIKQSLVLAGLRQFCPQPV